MRYSVIHEATYCEKLESEIPELTEQLALDRWF